MAIDPKKMEAWLNRDAKPEPKLDAKGKQTQPGKKGSSPKSKEDQELEQAAAEAEEEEGEESPEEKEAEGSLEEEFPVLFPLLEEYGELVEESTDILDPELLVEESSEWDEENEKLLLEAIDQLPQVLKKALKRDAKNLTWDKAQEISAALEAGDHITDPERVAGFLYWAGQYV